MGFREKSKTFSLVKLSGMAPTEYTFKLFELTNIFTRFQSVLIFLKIVHDL